MVCYRCGEDFEWSSAQKIENIVEKAARKRNKKKKDQELKKGVTSKDEPRFKDGEKVEARFRGMDRYYPGTIIRGRRKTALSVEATDDSNAKIKVLTPMIFDVKYDDGELEMGIEESLIRASKLTNSVGEYPPDGSNNQSFSMIGLKERGLNVIKVYQIKQPDTSDEVPSWPILMPCIVVSHGVVENFSGDAIVVESRHGNDSIPFPGDVVEKTQPIAPLSASANEAAEDCSNHTGDIKLSLNTNMKRYKSIHTVGPDYRECIVDSDDNLQIIESTVQSTILTLAAADALLASAYRQCLQVARDMKCGDGSMAIRTLAFPLLSAGNSRGDRRTLKDVLLIAVNAIMQDLLQNKNNLEDGWKDLTEVHLVACSAIELETLLTAADEILGPNPSFLAFESAEEMSQAFTHESKLPATDNYTIVPSDGRIDTLPSTEPSNVQLQAAMVSDSAHLPLEDTSEDINLNLSKVKANKMKSEILTEEYVAKKKWLLLEDGSKFNEMQIGDNRITPGHEFYYAHPASIAAPEVAKSLFEISRSNVTSLQIFIEIMSWIFFLGRTVGFFLICEFLPTHPVSVFFSKENFLWSFATTSALLLDLRHLRSIVLLLPSALHIRQSMLQLLFSFFAKKNDPSKSDINSQYVAFAASSMGFIMLAIILPTLIVHFIAMLQPSLPMVVISSGAENQISFLSSMKRHLLSMGDVSLWVLVASEPEINFLKGKASNRTLILGIPGVEVNLSDWKRFVQLYTPLLLWYMLGVTYRNHKNQKTISTSESLQQFDALERNQLLGQSSLWRKRLSLAFFAWQINRISAPWTSSIFMLIPSSMRFMSSYIACGSLLLHFVVQSRFAVLTIEIFTLFMLPVGTVWPMLASQSIYTNYFVAASILSAFFHQHF